MKKVPAPLTKVRMRPKQQCRQMKYCLKPHFLEEEVPAKLMADQGAHASLMLHEVLHEIMSKVPDTQIEAIHPPQVYNGIAKRTPSQYLRRVTVNVYLKIGRGPGLHMRNITRKILEEEIACLI